MKLEVRRKVNLIKYEVRDFKHGDYYYRVPEMRQYETEKKEILVNVFYDIHYDDLPEIPPNQVLRCVYLANTNTLACILPAISEENVFVNKEECEKDLEETLKVFNKTIIEANPELLEYCKLHNLIPENTKVEVLCDILYPGKYLCLDKNIICERINIAYAHFAMGMQPFFNWKYQFGLKCKNMVLNSQANIVSGCIESYTAARKQTKERIKERMLTEESENEDNNQRV